jgi:hypothetical protein
MLFAQEDFAVDSWWESFGSSTTVIAIPTMHRQEHCLKFGTVTVPSSRCPFGSIVAIHACAGNPTYLYIGHLNFFLCPCLLGS